MNNIQKQMKTWLSNYCGNVKEYESQVRKLINLNKNLTSKINSAYTSQDIEKVKELIEKFLIEEKKVWIQTCNNCEKVNYIAGESGERILDRKCEQCNQFLYKDQRDEIEESDEKDSIKRKCLYCNNPISPPNTVACYLHKNVSFYD